MKKKTPHFQYHKIEKKKKKKNPGVATNIEGWL